MIYLSCTHAGFAKLFASITWDGRGCKSISTPPKTVDKLLYFRIEYRLMITLATHQHQKKSLLNTQKTIYVVTSGRVIVTVQIHSRKRAFKGVKMTTAK
jgi:hypothetical protein